MPVRAGTPTGLVRANHVFRTDEKHIRTENVVIDKDETA
jgi:hypothetical protein